MTTRQLSGNPHADPDPDAWRALLARQHGLVTLEQVLNLGLSYETIRAHVAAGRWRAVGHGVFATYTGPLLPPARRYAAFLEHEPCALSHDTAAELWNFRDPDPTVPIHVVVPYGRSAVSSDDVVVHRSRAYAHVVVLHTEGVPVVSRAQTAIDLAVAQPTARRAMRVLLRCLVVTTLTGHQVLAAIEARRPRRYREALLAAVRYAVEGVSSELEATYVLDVEEAHGLPRAQRQVSVAVDGRQRYEDLAYRIGDRTALVRIDGHRHHADRATTLLDRRRDTAAELAGHARIVVGSPEVNQLPCRTAREVATMLAGIGWRGELRPCERCVGR